MISLRKRERDQKKEAKKITDRDKIPHGQTIFSRSLFFHLTDAVSFHLLTYSYIMR